MKHYTTTAPQEKAVCTVRIAYLVIQTLLKSKIQIIDGDQKDDLPHKKVDKFITHFMVMVKLPYTLFLTPPMYVKLKVQPI